MSVLPGLPFNREFAERGDSLLFHYLHYPGGKTLKILEAHRFSPTTKYPWCGMLEYEEFVRFDDTGDASAYGAVVRMAPKSYDVWVVLFRYPESEQWVAFINPFFSLLEATDYISSLGKTVETRVIHGDMFK